jgi:hypothetical protein
MTGVRDCVWDKALVYRCNDVMHHKCQLGHGMWIIENVCEDHHKYSYRALVSANVAYSMPCKYKRCGDRTFRLVPDRGVTGSHETLVSRDTTRRVVKDDWKLCTSWCNTQILLRLFFTFIVSLDFAVCTRTCADFHETVSRPLNDCRHLRDWFLAPVIPATYTAEPSLFFSIFREMVMRAFHVLTGLSVVWAQNKTVAHRVSFFMNIWRKNRAWMKIQRGVLKADDISDAIHEDGNLLWNFVTARVV